MAVSSLLTGPYLAQASGCYIVAASVSKLHLAW